MLSSDLARVIVEERERTTRDAARARDLLGGRRPPGDRPFLRLARGPLARLAAAWSR